MMSNTNIMVVEDSGIVLLDIQKSLKSLGYSVVATASSKKEAILKAEETLPDLVLMDIRLGDEMGGIEVADHIREHFNIPVVFLTGYADEDTFQHAKITDPLGYILKPFDPKGLRTAIEIALHNHNLKGQLGESEERYRTLVEMMNDGVGQADADGTIIFVNDKLCQMTGFSKRELIGRVHLSLFAEDHQDLQLEEFEKRKSGETNTFETVLIKKDGSTLPVILSGSPVFAQDGAFAGVIGVFTDISERKQSEVALQNSEERFRTLVNSTDDIVYTLDTEQRHTGIFGRWLDESSLSTEDFLGRTPRDILGEEAGLVHEEANRKALSGKNVVYDWENASDQAVLYFQTSVSPMRDEQGDIFGLVGIGREITELKQVELALQESEERYRTLFENSPISIWEEDFSEVQNSFMELRESGIVDFRAYFEKNMDEVSRLAGMVKLTHFNAASMSLFNVESKDEVPLNLLDFFFDESLEVVREEFIALAEGKTSFNAEIPIRDLAGQYRTFQLNLEVVPTYEKSLERVLVSILDITERKQTEQIMLARYRLVRQSLTLSLQELLQATLDEAELLTKSSIGFFHLVEADQVNLSLQAWSTNTIQNKCSAEGEGLHYPIDEAGVWVDCVLERTPIIHNEYETLEHRKGLPDGHAEIKRELVVPIIRGDKIVAVIGVGNKEVEYTSKDVEIVSLLADLAWDVVERMQMEEALRESEALYHDLVETAQDLIWQCDQEGRYVYLNPAWENVLGYQVEEMLGKSFTEFQTTESAKQDQEIFKKLLKGDAINGYETVHLGKDSRQVHLVFNAKSVYDEQGKVVGTRGTAYDITDRKRAEDALVKSEYLLRESQKLANMGHYNLDILSGNWKSSDTLNKLFGIDWNYQTDVEGWLQLIHPEDREGMASYFAEEVVKKHQDFDREYRIVRANDGDTRWVHGLGQLEFDDDGNPISMIGNIQDITERKLAEMALRDSAARYRAVVENQTELIVRWKPDGTRTFVNDAYLRYYDLTLEEALNQDFLPLVAEDDRIDVEKKVARLLSGEILVETDVHRVIRPDGTVGWQEWTDHVIHDDQGHIIEIQSVGRDITERKIAEEALRESEERMRLLAGAAHEGIVFTEAGKVIEANEQLAKMLGCELSELIGKSAMEFVAPESRSLVLEKIKSGAEEFYKHLAMKKDGTIFPVEVRAQMMTIQGRQMRVTAILDVTERQRADEMLAQERERLSNVIEGTNVGTWEWNVQTGETIFNERWAEIIGYSLEELSPISIDTWMKYAHPDDLTRSNELLEKHFNGELDYYECEVRMLHKNGDWVWVLDRGKVASWTEDGKPLFISGTHQEITERKLAEEALRAKTAELEALFSISAHLRTAQSADEMLPVVLTEMRRVFQSDANAVILLNSDSNHFTYALSDGSLAVNNGAQFDVENSISGLVLQSRQPYITEDFSSDPNKTAKLEGEDNLGPTAFAPVISESEFLGVLLCARNKEHRSGLFVESDVQLLTAIGEMVGNALRRARLYDQALTRLQNVQTLHSIDMAISANLDLSVILDVLLSQGTAQLEVDAASILLLNPHTHMLEFAAGSGFRTDEIKSAHLRLGEGLPGQAALDRKILHIPNLAEAGSLLRRHILDDGFVSYQAAPLIAKGQLQGVLEIFNRKLIVENDEQIGFLETLATQAAIAIDNSQLFSDLQRSNFELEMAYDATIEGWSRALELRDQETEGHTLRVTDMTLCLAQAMGIRSGELIHVRRGALLHDIGKVGVPDRILLKPGKLVGEEWEIMKKHTIYAFEMLWPIEFLRPAIDIPHCHHERWDGTGYPRQLKEEQIPLSARVFAVVDVWDALISNRPYRNAWTEDKALEYITSNAGKHFDPKVVELFMDLQIMKEL